MQYHALLDEFLQLTLPTDLHTTRVDVNRIDVSGPAECGRLEFIAQCVAPQPGADPYWGICRARWLVPMGAAEVVVEIAAADVRIHLGSYFEPELVLPWEDLGPETEDAAGQLVYAALDFVYRAADVA